MTIKWNTTNAEDRLIDRIVERVRQQSVRSWSNQDLCRLEMDLTACHKNGCPLKLKELLEAPDLDFFHDVYGIARHIDRETGELQDLFLPRYALNQGGDDAAAATG